MPDSDPFTTQRDVGEDTVTELSAAGFADAEEVGRGGFGVVYRCTEVALDRTVAVKLLTGELEDDRERFFREQRAMARLTGHPNFVGVLHVGETETGRPYLVMPFHRLGSLDARIRDNGPLSVEEVLRLGVKLAGALEAAHQAGVLHRDIKPGNVLLTDYGEPALTDFGIARIAGGFETETGAFTGSPAFTAPEVLGGVGPSRASDVYGLGATLFCALTGHAAFERRRGEEVVAQFVRITTQPVPDLRESGFAEDVCAVIEKTLSREPRDRPTAAELGEQLQRVQLAHGFTVDEMVLPEDTRATRTSSPGAEPALQDDIAFDRIAGPRHASAGNLPLELTSFVGRRTQVSEVKRLLSGSRLITLTGIGGIGKSRLALRVAHKVRDDFPGGVWLVELGELRDAASLADVIGAALGLRNHAGRPMLEVLVEFFSSRQRLLVLDNCEQVVEEVAELAQSLLQAGHLLRIMATSREALGIAGESVVAISPLTFPDPQSSPSLRSLAAFDAVTLFAQRAAAAVPGFELTDSNRLSVVGICSRLDGLPLAIELAAARLRTMSPEQLLLRLTDRFTLLTGGRRGAPTRQQTLRWCIGWSYDLCTGTEQRLWNHLSVFARGFELDAAQQVCGADLAEPELLDSISALVDKSILIREDVDDTVRFRMLETVQEYGRDQLEGTGDYPQLSRRHRDWYEHLAITAEAEWMSPRQLKWIARLERELPNLRQAMESSLSEQGEHALRIAHALFPFWLVRGRPSEGRRWCDRALSRSSGAPNADRAKALVAAVMLAATLGDFGAAASRLAELRGLAERTAEPISGALLAYADGFIALVCGDPIRASALMKDAADTFGARGELTTHSRALLALGLAYALQGDTGEALARVEQALAIADSHGETVYQSYVLGVKGLTYWLQGEPGRAVHYLGNAVQLSRLVIDPIVAAISSEVLAWIAAEDGDARRAAVLLGIAEQLGRSLGGSGIVFSALSKYHEECEHRAVQVLGTKAYKAERRNGSAMSFDAAVEFVLGQQARVTPTDRYSVTLTKRERQVAELVAEGLTNRAIAARLMIAHRTAQGHVEHILTKLGFTSRAQIAAWVAEQSHREPQ